ncbi:hypothetical protein T01_3959, partial [Trichinella spiralis]
MALGGIFNASDGVCLLPSSENIHLFKSNQGTLCGKLRFGIGNPGIASCDGELGADG